MRIIGGSHRGRKLLSPVGQDIRPTSDRTRQAVFNALQHRQAVVDSVVLDGFCGTGALAFEALSQGSTQAVLMDVASSSLDLAKKNAAGLGFVDDCVFFQHDSTKLMNRPLNTMPASLIFLDPPYRKGFVMPAVKALQDGGWFAATGWLIVETEKDISHASLLLDDSFNLDTQKTYGDTVVSFFQWS